MEGKTITWPGWDVVRKIGSGSFGSVYEIERKVFERTEKAALKVITIPQNNSDIDDLYSDGYDSESITQRYQSYLEDIVREYSLMAEMKGNTNVVYCDDFRYIQHDDGIGWDIYIKMELLTPLVKMLPKNIPDEVAIRLGIDICNALVLCKKRNIIHRDIKPQNIFVSQDGDYKLGDFGIAKAVERTTSGTKTGTYKYMAPEVYNNEPYGSASDIYSLGLVLYWLLNERRTPFLPLPPETPTARMEDEARNRRLQGEKIPGSKHGSKSLKAIVLKACAYEPKDRYADPAEMKRELEALLYGKTTELRPAPEPEPLPEVVDEPEQDITVGPEVPANDEDEITVGPVIPQMETDEPEEDVTIGPESPQVSEEGDEGGTVGSKHLSKKRFAGWILVAVAIVVLFTALALPKFIGVGTQSSTDMYSDRVEELLGDVVSVSMKMIAAGEKHIVAILEDGTVVATGDNSEGQCNVGGWSDVVEVIAGDAVTYGLRADGAVLMAGTDPAVDYTEISQWTDIQTIDAKQQGLGSIVGVKSDGTVVFAGYDEISLRSFDGWTNIVDVAAGRFDTVGLRADGTVLTTGYKTSEGAYFEVSSWTDIVAVAAAQQHIIGLKSDGTVVVDGVYSSIYRAEEWTDIVGIYSGWSGDTTGDSDYVLGLKSDGTVVVAGAVRTESAMESARETIENSEEWTGIVSVTGGKDGYVVGLKADGTLVITQDNTNDLRQEEQWTNIMLPTSSIEKKWVINNQTLSAGDWHTVAVMVDGTVVATGENIHGSCDVTSWRDIVSVDASDYVTIGLKKDGTVVATGWNDQGQCNIEDWSGISAVDTEAGHTVGLKNDGTVVAVGNNGTGACNVTEWSDIVDIDTGRYFTLGLRADGTVLSTAGDLSYGDTDMWTDIIAIEAAKYHAIGLKSDGTIVIAGDGEAESIYSALAWTGIIAIFADCEGGASQDYLIGIKEDGTVVRAGDAHIAYDDTGSQYSDSWTDIVSVTGGSWGYIAGLRADGTVVSDGYNVDGMRDTSEWSGIKLPGAIIIG